MSIHHTSIAWKLTGLSLAEKAILVNLADYANKDTGLAYPCIETIARECCCSEKTVRNNIGSLREKGLIDWRPIKELRHRGLVVAGRINPKTSCYELKFGNANPAPSHDKPESLTGCETGTSFHGNRNLFPKLPVRDTDKPSGTVIEPSPLPPKGELGLRIRLCSLFGHRDARLKDQKLNRSWSMAWATGQLDDEAVGLVEWWYGFRAKPAAAQPKPYWCRSSLPTLLNNWIDDVEFIRMKRKVEEDNWAARDGDSLIEMSN